jgi:hypothetical protein
MKNLKQLLILMVAFTFILGGCSSKTSDDSSAPKADQASPAEATTGGSDEAVAEGSDSAEMTDAEASQKVNQDQETIAEIAEKVTGKKIEGVETKADLTQDTLALILAHLEKHEKQDAFRAELTKTVALSIAYATGGALFYTKGSPLLGRYGELLAKSTIDKWKLAIDMKASATAESLAKGVNAKAAPALDARALNEAAKAKAAKFFAPQEARYAKMFPQFKQVHVEHAISRRVRQTYYSAQRSAMKNSLKSSLATKLRVIESGAKATAWTTEKAVSGARFIGKIGNKSLKYLVPMAFGGLIIKDVFDLAMTSDASDAEMTSEDKLSDFESAWRNYEHNKDSEENKNNLIAACAASLPSIIGFLEADMEVIKELEGPELSVEAQDALKINGQKIEKLSVILNIANAAIEMKEDEGAQEEALDMISANVEMLIELNTRYEDELSELSTSADNAAQ